MRIDVHFEYPPIPDRNFDWCATFDGYEPGDPMGWGRDAEKAVIDLFSNLSLYENHPAYGEAFDGVPYPSHSSSVVLPPTIAKR
jgi:hypothetical protein